MMGSDKFYAEEKPVYKVTVDGLWIDKYPVTNKTFSAFIWATNYITVAERPLNLVDFPSVPVDILFQVPWFFKKEMNL